jgi:hypothetical protein
MHNTRIFAVTPMRWSFDRDFGLTAKVTAICENQPSSTVRNDYSFFGMRRNIDLTIK